MATRKAEVFILCIFLVAVTLYCVRLTGTSFPLRLTLIGKNVIDYQSGNMSQPDPGDLRHNVTFTVNKTKTFPYTCAANKRFFNCCYPVTALASFPGSGNTWVRHLLEEATGYYTGSIYNDRSLKKAGFKGEGKKNGNVIAVKTHRTGNKTRVKYDRALVLTRSPLGCFPAEFNRHKGRGHTEHAKKDVYVEAWPSFFNRSAKNWLTFHKYWFSQDIPTLVVKYEDLKTNLRHQLKRILSFLGLPITEERLDCVAQNAEGNFQRKPQTDGVDPFTDDMKAEVERLVSQMEEMKDNMVTRQTSQQLNRNKDSKGTDKPS